MLALEDAGLELEDRVAHLARCRVDDEIVDLAQVLVRRVAHLPSSSLARAPVMECFVRRPTGSGKTVG